MKRVLLIAGACFSVALAGCSTQNSGGTGNDFDTQAGNGVSTKGSYNANSATENPRGSWQQWNNGESGIGQKPAEQVTPPDE